MSHTYTTPEPPERAFWQKYGLVPNAITILRIIGCLVPMWMIMNPQDYPLPFVIGWMMPWWLASIIVLAIVAATDWADGWSARRFNSITALGEKLDPVADKLLIGPTFFAICVMGLIVEPWGWIIFALTITPEVVLITMNIYLMARRIPARIPSIMPGKIKMWIQSVALLLALMPVAGVAWQVLVIGCFGIGIGFSYVATYAYLRTGVAIAKAAR